MVTVTELSESTDLTPLGFHLGVWVMRGLGNKGGETRRIARSYFV